MRRLRVVLAAGLVAVCVTGCAGSGPPPLEPISERVDLERFMGDWYVLASIPIDFWFASEAGGHNGIERYELREDGKIQTTYTFRRDGFDGEEVRFEPIAWVHDTETNAEWRMQFVWPFRAAYLIAYLADDYEQAIVGVPDRSYVWILSRTPSVPPARYEALTRRVAELGYDPADLEPVPQAWDE